MNTIKRIAALLAALWLTGTLSATAYAHEVPDLSRRGSVTVEMRYDGKAVTGGTLAAYRVGQIEENSGDYRFGKTAEMGALPDSYDDIGSPALAKNVATYISAQGISAYKTADNTGGKAVFAEMETGLYLIEQTRASDGYEPINPFLISVPMNEGGEYRYDVTAEGKFSLRQLATPTPTPSESPTPPPRPIPPWRPFRPKLPQTGQLNWPVPVLTVLGLGVFTAGWVLRFGKRKDEDER